MRRTVGGKPVDDAQIVRIVTAVREALGIDDTTRLLDLCCGNAALTDRIAADVLGVDFSPPIIEVACRDFARPNRRYLLGDAAEWVRTVQDEGWNRALCYGAYSYLPREAALGMLADLRRRCPGVQAASLGNLPDRGACATFFASRPYTPGMEDRHDTQIGVWYDPEPFLIALASVGWRGKVRRMNEGFYGHGMRFDVLLHPLE